LELGGVEVGYSEAKGVLQKLMTHDASGIATHSGWIVGMLMTLFASIDGAVAAESDASAGLRERHAWIAGSLLDFQYREFSGGRELDREDGTLVGVAGGIDIRQDRWVIGFEGSIHTGTADYDGETNITMIPVKTDTDETIVNVAGRAEYWFGEAGEHRWSLYGLVGYRYWERSIQSTSFASGGREDYYWLYIGAGIKGYFTKSAKQKWMWDIRANLPVDPKIYIDDLDEELDLGARPGYRFAVSWQYVLSEKVNLLVEPYYETWDIGKSNSVFFTDGIDVYKVYEPDSETRNTGLNIGVRWNF